MKWMVGDISVGWLLLLGCIGAGAARGPVVVDRQPAQIETKYFDPANRSREMPPLKGTEAAVTQSQFGIASLMEVAITQHQPDRGQEQVTAHVDRVRVTLDLKITIWLPENANEKLTAHEEGHRRVAELFYRDAEKKAEAIAREWIGTDLSGEGKDTESAASAAMNKAMEQINARYMAVVSLPASRAQEKYDELTDHGRNKLDEDEAIRRAMEQTKSKSPATTRSGRR